MTQKELAANLGISACHLGQIESNKRAATVKLLEKTCETIGIDIAVLLIHSLGESDFKNTELAKLMLPTINNMILELCKEPEQ